MFQAPSLVPWLTAYDNVGLGVEQVFPHATKGERNDIIEHYLNRVGLADAAQKKAFELSNGMKQRVGIARAFALSPKLLLLDEPFGMLDSLTRWDLQEVLMEVWSRTQLTAIMVTHDVDEPAASAHAQETAGASGLLHIARGFAGLLVGLRSQVGVVPRPDAPARDGHKLRWPSLQNLGFKCEKFVTPD